MVNGRYYCTGCGGRATPYDSLEVATEAPEAGVSGHPVLLSSYNTRRRQHGESPVAYCDGCGGWKEARYVSGEQLLRDRLARDGVVFRLPRSRTQRYQALAQLLNQRRGSPAKVVVPLRKGA